MDYSKLTVARLKELCDEQGLEYPANVKKAELVGYLEKFAEPIEVEAETIDGEMIQVKPFSVDMTLVHSDIDELTRAMDEALTVYGDLLVEREVVDGMAVADLLVCENQLGKAIAVADEARKQLGRDYRKPLEAANARYKELMQPVEELYAAYSERRQELRYEGLERTYLDCCAANGLETLPSVVPFERLAKAHPQWLRRDANAGKAAERVEDEVMRIGRAWGTLRSQRAAMRFYDEAEAEFFKSLDVERAIGLNNRREQEQARIDALRAEHEANEAARREAEARRQEQEAQQQAAGRQQPAPPPAQAQPQHAQRQEERRRYTFSALLSDRELASLREWKNATGIGEDWRFGQ